MIHDSNPYIRIIKQLDNLIKSRFIEMFGDLDSNSKNWTIKTIGDVAKVPLHYGSTASAIDYDSEIRYVRITDIGSDGKLNDDFKSPSTYDPSYLLNKGDVLFARSGSVGVTYYFDEPYKSIFAGYLIRFIPDDKIINPEFAYQFTRSTYCQGILVGSKRGGVQKNVNAKQLSAIPIPLPPMDLQNEFIEFVHQVDKSKVIAQKAAERYDLILRSRFNELFGDPILNEKQWNKVTLRSITSKIGSGATPSGGKSSYLGTEIALVRSMNVHDSMFDYSDLAHITKEQAQTLSNVELKKSDVLLNITGASVARCCILPDDVLPGRVNQHVCIIRPNPELLDSFYLNGLLITNSMKAYLLNISKSNGATREAITKEMIESLSIILPPIKLQKQYANFIHCVDKMTSRALQ